MRTSILFIMSYLIYMPNTKKHNAAMPHIFLFFFVPFSVQYPTHAWLCKNGQRIPMQKQPLATSFHASTKERQTKHSPRVNKHFTYANANPSKSSPYSYNQSGPLMPPLCYPFDSHLQDNHCGDQEVSIANASLVRRVSFSNLFSFVLFLLGSQFYNYFRKLFVSIFDKLRSLLQSRNITHKTFVKFKQNVSLISK